MIIKNYKYINLAYTARFLIFLDLEYLSLEFGLYFLFLLLLVQIFVKKQFKKNSVKECRKFQSLKIKFLNGEEIGILDMLLQIYRKEQFGFAVHKQNLNYTYIFFQNLR